MASLMRSIGAAVAGAAVALAGACEQPTGVVLKIDGIAAADELWLAVGDKQMTGPASPLRFEASQINTLLTAPEGQTSYHEGYEIFLDRDAFLERPRLGLVLDATVPAGDPATIVRGSYLLEAPDAGTLTEVRLSLGQLGPGQWVCTAQRGDASTPSFLVDGGTDCDRDGWIFGADPDDLDPVRTGPLSWAPDPVNPALCLIRAGSRALPFRPILSGGCGAGCTRPPLDVEEIDGCLDAQDVVRCEISKRSFTFPVRTLLGNRQVTNPDWELVKLGGEGATAVFAPTFEALDDWAVTFELPQSTFALFLLSDRARAGSERSAMAIRVEVKDDGKNECKVDPR
jgi:hypothetical protein